MNNQSERSFFIAASPLFLALFIDGMGLGLLFPILSEIIMRPESHFLPYHMSQNGREIIYGILIAVFMFCWFFGAALLGDISDIIGRKKSLIISLIGSFIGYFLSAVGVVIYSLSFLFLGRIIAGFTAGSQAVAQAAVVDLSSPEHKSRNIGLILFFVSLGFIVGPLLGGFLSDNKLVHWFNFSTPLFFASIISFANAVLLGLLFHETFIRTGSLKIKVNRAIEIFASGFKNKNIRVLALVFLMMQLGWSNYYAFISMYLFSIYGFSTVEIATFMALLALGFGVGFIFLVDYCIKYFLYKKTIVVSFLLTTVFISALLFSKETFYPWMSAVLVGITLAVGYAAIISLLSNQVDEDSQGWIMGVTGSIGAFSFGITGLCSSILTEISVKVPLILSALFLIISAVILAKYKIDH